MLTNWMPGDGSCRALVQVPTGAELTLLLLFADCICALYMNVLVSKVPVLLVLSLFVFTALYVMCVCFAVTPGTLG